MKHSIMAGCILTLLQKTNRPASLEEIQDYLKESMVDIGAGVHRLVKEGLAVIDVDALYPKVSLINSPAKRDDDRFKYSEFYLSELLKEGGVR